MSDTLKKKFKDFFQTREATDETIEFTRMFIMPFASSLKKRGLSVDDVIGLFFSVEDRKFFYARANRDFKLPGALMVTGARGDKGQGPRSVRKGQKMLVVLDKKDGFAKIELKMNGEYLNYRLEQFEIKTIQDWIEEIK